jgi:parvulin-like peptidyl-prolyl isomerase
MKTGLTKKTIISLFLLLLSASAQAAVQNSPTPTADAAVPANPSISDKPALAPTAASKVETKPAEEESSFITLKVPLFNPAFANVPVAEVNDEGISMEELLGAIGAMHMGKEEQKTTARKSYSDILNRLINIKLMVQEAYNIGLDQLPEIKNLVNQFEKATLKEILFAQRTKDVKVDENEVEKLYREMIKEWKITPARFTKEDDAKKMEMEIRGGGNFDLLMEKALKDGPAQGSKESIFVRASGINPMIAKAAGEMKTGAISSVIPVDGGFAIFRLEDVVFPENAETRKQAWKDMYNRAKQQELNKFRKELFEKYVKINDKLLKQLDFEAPKPGFAKMLEDKRTVAEIKGEKPVTVGDLAHGLNEKFFHGIASPIREKKVNVLKSNILIEVIAKSLIVKEALQQGIDKTSEYQYKVKEYRETVVFGTFVENVVRRDVNVTENEGKKYYSEHLKEYTYPAMVRINGLAFKTMEAAQACIDKLRQGVDYKWLKTTADGQLPDDTPNLMKFAGELVAVTSLPDDLGKVLAGVHSDDYRIFSDSPTHYYALQIKEHIPPQEMPYKEARQTVIGKVYGENLKKVMDDWTNKLRDASVVKIYADFGDIR